MEALDLRVRLLQLALRQVRRQLKVTKVRTDIEILTGDIEILQLSVLLVPVGTCKECVTILTKSVYMQMIYDYSYLVSTHKEYVILLPNYKSVHTKNI